MRQAAEHEARDLVTRADLYRALLVQTGVLIGAGIAVLRGGSPMSFPIRVARCGSSGSSIRCIANMTNGSSTVRPTSEK